MDFESGMMPGMPTGDKPYGNSRSLVSEISGRGVNGKEVPAAKHGMMPEIKRSTLVKNNCFQDLKDTGRS